jgi:hypothetical protein
MRKLILVIGLLAAVAPAAYALEGAGAIPGSFGLIPAIFDDGINVFTVVKMNNVGSIGVALHYYLVRTTDWSINNKCIYMSANDFDWYVFDQMSLGLLEFDYSQGGMAYFTVVTAAETSTCANSKYSDLNGVACGGVLLDHDAIKGEEFVLDVPNNLSWEIPLVTYEGNDGYDGVVGNGVIGGDDGYYTYGPLGAANFWELLIHNTTQPKYFANYPDIYYVEWLPQGIVPLEQVCVPNQAYPVAGPDFPGGVWGNEATFSGLAAYDVYEVRSWNDCEEPLPSVQPFTCFCWQVDTIGDITQLDLALFGPNGGWTREASLVNGLQGFYEGPGTIQVTIEAIGGPFARGGSNYAAAYYTHHERTVTEAVADQCDNGVPLVQDVFGDSQPLADQDVWSFAAQPGTQVAVTVDTVTAMSAFDIEACLSTTTSSADCFVFGDDETTCTFPPPAFGCPQISTTLPPDTDGDGIYYVLVESGSGPANYAGPLGAYRLRVGAACISPLTLVINNRPGTFDVSP